MKLDPNMASNAGLTGFATGAHVGQLTAKKVIAQTGTQGIEFTLWLNQNSSINYLRVNYQKADGSIIKFGMNIVMAMMGLCGLEDIAIEHLPNEAVIPEFNGKQIGLALQKVYYTKTTDGTDGYKFEVRLPFHVQTGKTYREYINNEPATYLNEVLAELTDRDEREAMPEPQQQHNQNVPQKMAF